MTESDRDIAELLRALDHVAPPVRVEDVIARAGARPRWRISPIAAAAVLFVAAVAAALPFTPAYDAIGREVKLAIERARHRDAPVAIQPLHGAGVAVAPGARLRVKFVAPRAGSRVRVMLASVPSVSLLPEDGDAAFSVRDEEIIVSDATASMFTLTVPQSVDDLRVESDGALLLAKRGPAVVTRAGRGEDGSYLVELMPRP